MVNDACASRFKSSRLIGPWIEGITRADIDVGSNLVRVGNSIVIDGINQTTICFLSFFLSFLLSSTFSRARTSAKNCWTGCSGI